MAPAVPPYAELHCRSNFSFLTGASHPEELVAQERKGNAATVAKTNAGGSVDLF